MENLYLDDVLHDHHKKKYRDAMLNLILAWGELDGALGMLVSCLLGKPMVEGAEAFGKFPALAKFQEIYKKLRDAPNGKDTARVVKKHKKTTKNTPLFAIVLHIQNALAFGKATQILLYLLRSRNMERMKLPLILYRYKRYIGRKFGDVRRQK